MITVTFLKNQQYSMGLRTVKGIFDVGSAALDCPEGVPKTSMELLLRGEGGKESLARLLDRCWGESSFFLPEESLEYGSCVMEPQKIIGVGLNYRRHADECGLPYPEAPILFGKFNNTLAGHKQVIPLPRGARKVDYEGELAVVIGEKAKNVKAEEALSYVYGYCIANDLSARDWQTTSSQWFLGKSCDNFCPTGPYLVSRDEIENPNKLSIQTYVNGAVRQDSSTSDMIFSCEEIVSYASRHMTLFPGDIILTGTPEGVIMGYPEERQHWLKAGDTVSVRIEKLG